MSSRLIEEGKTGGSIIGPAGIAMERAFAVAAERPPAF